MGKIIAVANSKGGVGKTTLCRNLALACKLNDETVLALDCDPQKSMQNFFSQRAERLDAIDIDCDVKSEALNLKRYIQHKTESFDRVIVDVGGRDSGALRQVLLAAEAVIIPTTTGQESTDALEQMMEVLEDVRGVNESLQAFLLINMVPSDVHDTTASVTAEGLKELYENANTTVLNSQIKQRKAWLQSAYGGFAIWEIPRGEKAAEEFNKVIDELVEKEVL